MNRTIKRIREVMQITGLSRSTIYKMIDEGRFPAPLKLGRRAVGWTDKMIEDWVNSLEEADRNA